MKLQIHSNLDYDFPQPTDILIQVEAAIIPEQFVENAWIDLPPVEHFARVPGEDTIGDRIWLRTQGKLIVDYTATVTIDDPSRVLAFSKMKMARVVASDEQISGIMYQLLGRDLAMKMRRTNTRRVLDDDDPTRL